MFSKGYPPLNLIKGHVRREGMDKVPMFTQEQVEYLNRLYPEMCPNLKMTEREIWRYVGARELVRHINHLFQDQLESNKLLRK